MAAEIRAAARAKFITRYNWSSYYAMAVIELGQAVEQALRTSKP